MVSYFDASALVKLVVREAESVSLRARVSPTGYKVTSLVGRIELERAMRRRTPPDSTSLDGVLDGMTIVPVDVAVAAVAARVAPSALRTLDAIHLATMIALRDDIDVVYCYDERLAAAAREHGLSVASPA